MRAYSHHVRVLCLAGNSAFVRLRRIEFYRHARKISFVAPYFNAVPYRRSACDMRRICQPRNIFNRNALLVFQVADSAYRRHGVRTFPPVHFADLLHGAYGHAAYLPRAYHAVGYPCVYRAFYKQRRFGRIRFYRRIFIA